MRKIAYKFSEVIILLFVIFVWLFSFYKVASYVASLNFNIWGIGPDLCFWGCPPKPPLPPEPPCPPGCLPPCVTPTPTPTPPVEPTPTPTPPAGGPPEVGGPPAGEPGPPGPPHCGAETPKAPYLRSLSVLGGGQVKLIWDPVEPATHYTISYGPSSGNYLYGVDNTGKVTSFIVGGLWAGTYCFAVRAVNDCAPGELSNERCAGAGAPQVLGLATTSGDSALNPVFFWMGLFLLAGGSYLGLKRS